MPANYDNHPPHIQSLGRLYDAFEQRQTKELETVKGIQSQEAQIVQGAFRILETVLNEQDARISEVYDRGQELLADLERGLNGVEKGPAR